MSEDQRYEIRARLMAARAFHPGPWRVIGGMLVDGEGLPVDFDVPAMRDFFRHLLADMELLTEGARRRSNTRDLRPSGSSPGLRLPHAGESTDEHVAVRESLYPGKIPSR